MKKGFQITLLAMAASIAGISSSYAAAPVISSLPDITIGDAEDNGSTDNNYFVFTNAFRFDDHVSDADTDVTTLLWTFSEGNDPAAATGTPYYQVNDKDAVAIGDAAEAALGSTTPDPRHEPANNVRTSEYAEIRDIVLSPISGSIPFADPASLPDNTKAKHEAGKAVTFYVSDGQNIDSDEIIVKTIDNASDFASPTSTYQTEITNDFTSTAGWAPTGGNTAVQTTSHNTANSALYATVTAGTGTRSIGWLEAQAKTDTGNPHLLFADVDAGQVIRGKFSIFATGQASKSLIPNIKVRLTARFGFAALTEILHHTPGGDAEGTVYSADLAPSQDPNAPTVYRADMVRPNLPYFDGAGAGEGVQRMFEAYSTGGEPDAVGTIALTESSLGVYDAPAADAGSQIKLYATAADFTTSYYYDLRQYARGTLALTNANINGANSGGTFGGQTWAGIPGTEVTQSAGAAGISASTAGTPDNKLATVALDFLNGNAEDVDHTKRARVATDKQYLVRFTASATGAASNNALLRFRVRTAKFNYNSRIEVGGAWNLAIGTERDAARESHILAQQYLPGTGGYTGTYDVIMVSPLTSERSVPSLESQDGPGAGPATRTTASRRDINPAVDIIDSLSGSYWQTGSSDPAEKGNVSVSRIEIHEFPLVED